ncbi:MAG: amidohydrolase [Acidobacteria bacterium]|nr:amidohydrolase [Acidobacteriota bacterium]
MKRCMHVSRAVVAGALLTVAAGCAGPTPQQEAAAPAPAQGATAAPAVDVAAGPADVILSNGKVITVDDRFTIAQAIAIKGDRVLAVGTTDDIKGLAGPSTRTIDLAGRTVVPGLIDNHAHFMEEGVLWTVELRLDGIETRAQAVDMIRAKAASLPAGRWVFVLGGWSPDQFTDDKKPFTKAELDAISTDHPILLQFTRAETYLNSKAVELTGIEAKTDAWVRRDASGKATGVVDAAGAGAVSGVIPPLPIEQVEPNSLAMIRELNASGLTASGGTCPDDFVPIFRKMASENRLNKRFFCLVAVPMGTSADTVTKGLPKIADLKLFQGDMWVDHFAYGEGNYGPASDNMVAVSGTQKPEDFEQWGRIAREVARAGMPMHSHTTLDATADGFLTQIEKINREFPVRNLRWTLIHGEQLKAADLARMRALGVSAAIQPRATIMGGIFHRVHGDRAFNMPDFRTIQDSGVIWGLGTDTFEVNQYRPFTTLYTAVTGKMVGGTVVNHRTVSREDALIAHTKGSAYTILQEHNLGSIAAGKMADLVVIDRDYLTIPADEIKNIKPVMTMVGGRVVYDTAAPATQTAAR